MIAAETRSQRYEAKGERPRKGFLVRLSEAEEAKALRLSRDGEKVPAVLRRLLREASSPAPQR